MGKTKAGGHRVPARSRNVIGIHLCLVNREQFCDRVLTEPKCDVWRKKVVGRENCPDQKKYSEGRRTSSALRTHRHTVQVKAKQVTESSETAVGGMVTGQGEKAEHRPYTDAC